MVSHALLAVAPGDPNLSDLLPATKLVIANLVASGSLGSSGADNLTAEERVQRVQRTLDAIPSSIRGVEWATFRAVHLLDAPAPREMKRRVADTARPDRSAFSSVEQRKRARPLDSQPSRPSDAAGGASALMSSMLGPAPPAPAPFLTSMPHMTPMPLVAPHPILPGLPMANAIPLPLPSRMTMPLTSAMPMAAATRAAMPMPQAWRPPVSGAPCFMTSGEHVSAPMYLTHFGHYGQERLSEHVIESMHRYQLP